MESVFDKDFLLACLNSKHDIQVKKLVNERVSVLFQTVPQEEAFIATQRDVTRLKTIYAGCSVKQQKCNLLMLLNLLAMALPPPPSKKSCATLTAMSSFLLYVARKESDISVLLAVLEGTVHLVSKFKVACLQEGSSMNHLLFIHFYCVDQPDQRIAHLSQELSETLKEVVRGSSDLVRSESLSEASYAVLLESAATPGASSVPRQLWCFEWIRFVYDLPGHLFTPHLIPTAAVLAALADSSGSPVTRRLLELLNETRCEFMKVIAQNSAYDLAPFYDFCCSVFDKKWTDTGFQTAVADWLREVLFFSSLSSFVPFFDKLLSGVLRLLDADAAGNLYEASALVNERAMELFRESDCRDDAHLFARTLRCTTPFLAAARSTTVTTPEVRERSCLASIKWVELAYVCFTSSSDDQKCTVDLLVPLVVCERHAVSACALTFLWTLCSEENLNSALASKLALLFMQEPLCIPLHLPRVLDHLQGLDNGNDSNNNSNKQTNAASDDDDEALAPCPLLELFVRSVSCCSDDVRSVAKVAFTIHILLLTSPTFVLVRRALPRAETLFANLFGCLKYQCVASLALCLLAQKYHLSRRLAELMSRRELSPNTLMQLDRLAELLNSPVFAFLRCHLVSRHADVDLSECLYIILMILPVYSPQHNALSERLRTAADCIRSRPLTTASSSADPAKASVALEQDLCYLKQLQLAQAKLGEFTC